MLVMFEPLTNELMTLDGATVPVPEPIAKTARSGHVDIVEQWAIDNRFIASEDQVGVIMTAEAERAEEAFEPVEAAA